MEFQVRVEYARRRAEYAQAYAASMARARRLLVALLIVLMAALVLGVKVVYGRVPVWWLAVPVVVMVALEPVWRRARGTMMRAMRLLRFYEFAEPRADGTGVQSGEKGEAFRTAGHLFARDLDVLGADSLFGMLATTRTAVGQRALAALLLEPVETDSVRARQAAVRELTPMLELREAVELLGPSAFAQIPAESLERWLRGGTHVFRPWMRWSMGAITLSWTLLLVAQAMQRADIGLLPRNLAALLAVQAALALALRSRVAPELERAQRLAGQTAILREGLEVLRAQSFESPMLRTLQQEAADGEGLLRGVARSFEVVEQRTKEWFYLPSMLFGLGTQAAMALDAWRTQHGDAMRRWVGCWSAFEALLAMATYAREHPENCWPEILEDGEAVFTAEGLRHPLLGAAAVANDVRLGGGTRFLLVSGSNMAGKSTLLRAVGATAVLAQAGAPVCAQALRMSVVRVGASIAVGDSLADGRSKFLAEAERLRDVLALARGRSGGCLFLIDEIFSGTNSADRRVAADAVLRGLVEAGAVGLLSTHDLALTDVEGIGGVNVHMASPVEGDPLAFDYLLKAGVNRTTNGLAIVRMLGLLE